VISNFWKFFLFKFFLEFALFVSIFFPKNIVKLGKFTTRKMCWLLGGWSNYLNQNFHEFFKKI
jgi:hypothetical protein